MMKRLFRVAALICLLMPSADASTSIVTATPVDTDGIAWIHGTWKAKLTLPNGPLGAQTPTAGGHPVQTVIHGAMDDAGLMTAALTDTSSLDQPGGLWLIQVCPDSSVSQMADTGCVLISTPAVGAAVNLTSRLSGIKAPRFPAGPTAYGYADIEVARPSTPGMTYYNTGAGPATQGLRMWDGRTWRGVGNDQNMGNPYTTTAQSASTASLDFVMPGTARSGAPARTPNNRYVSFSSPIQGSDSYWSSSDNITIASGSGNFLVGEDNNMTCPDNWCDEESNMNAWNYTLTSFSPVQGGGSMGGLTSCYAPGDCIGTTQTVYGTGPSRITDEGLRLDRRFLGFKVDRWGGRITSIGKPDENGQTSLQVVPADGSNLNTPGEWTAPYINTSRPVDMGNATVTQPWPTDTRFQQVTLDKPIASSMLSSYTVTTAPVDNGVYTGCPGTRSGYYKKYVFNAGPSGTGNDLTKSYCWTVENTTGMKAGTRFVAAGNAANFEVSMVKQVVDVHHFIADAKVAHATGTLISWGGYAGYAGSFPADNRAPGTINATPANWNVSILYLAPLSMGCFTPTSCVFFNIKIAGGWNSFAYQSNTPQSQGALGTPVVKDGVITSIPVTNRGHYQTKNINLAMQSVLAPPTVTVTGCTTAPKAHVVYGVAYIIDHIQIDKGGSGCGTVTASLQTTWPNPFVMYPAALMYRAIKVDGDGNVIVGANQVPVTNSGYALMMPLMGPFSVGDHILESTWQAQSDYGNLVAIKRYLGYRSAMFGDVNITELAGESSGSYFAYRNVDPESLFYGTSANHFMPDNHGSGYTTAPGWQHYTGAYSSAMIFDEPPLFGSGGRPTDASGVMFQVRCWDQAHPCANGFVQPFDLWSVLLNNANFYERLDMTGSVFSIEGVNTINLPPVANVITVNTDTVNTSHLHVANGRQPFRFLGSVSINGASSVTYQNDVLKGVDYSTICMGNVESNPTPSVALSSINLDRTAGRVTAILTGSTYGYVDVICNVP